MLQVYGVHVRPVRDVSLFLFHEVHFSLATATTTHVATTTVIATTTITVKDTIRTTVPYIAYTITVTTMIVTTTFVTSATTFPNNDNKARDNASLSS